MYDHWLGEESKRKTLKKKPQRMGEGEMLFLNSCSLPVISGALTRHLYKFVFFLPKNCVPFVTEQKNDEEILLVELYY